MCFDYKPLNCFYRGASYLAMAQRTKSAFGKGMNPLLP